jgi:DNA-binding transcriptional regulator YhcF (GntR family)
MVGLVAARFEQDADANPVPVVWLDAQDLVGPRSAEECGAAPLYLRGARLIERNIRDRRLAVGSLLPTEHELSSSLKVSRQTVRHAIAHLRDQGLLSARKGVGTRVERPKCVLRIAKTSRPVAVSRSNSAAGRGGDGINSVGRASMYPAETAFCWTEVYLDWRLAPIVRPIDVLRTAVSSWSRIRLANRSSSSGRISTPA